MNASTLDTLVPGLREFLDAERGRKAALADALGVRRHHLSAWLRGENLPSASNAAAAVRWLHAQSSAPAPVPAKEKMVLIPHRCAELIRRAFVPRNPAKMRGAHPDVVSAAREFIRAVESA